MSAEPTYKRILLKISGEALSDSRGGPHGAEALDAVVREVLEVKRLGVELAVVLGAGNLVRGRALRECPQVRRVTADAMGMLATVVNALALRDALENAGDAAEVLSALEIPRLCGYFRTDRGRDALAGGRTLILAGGTGNPFFTTDSGAALRAAELDAEVLFKATKVDGVYDADPETHPDAKKFDTLTCRDVIDRGLGVMDLTAASMCMENRIPIVVFRLATPGALRAAVCGQAVGTRVDPSGDPHGR